MVSRGAAAAGDEADGRGALAELVDDPSSRKRFLRMVGGAGAAGALATLAAACGGREPPIGSSQDDPGTVSLFGPGDIGIVNFALFLEYVEGDFYDRIVEGDEVSARGLRELFKDVRANEEEHRRALDRVSDQIGRPVRRPHTDFEDIFSGGQSRILSFSATLENLGASAYLGQAPLIHDRSILESALTIHTVEARHAATLNERAGRPFQGRGPLRGSVPNGPFARPMTTEQVLKRVKPFLKDGVPRLESPDA